MLGCIICVQVEIQGVKRNQKESNNWFIVCQFDSFWGIKRNRFSNEKLTDSWFFDSESVNWVFDSESKTPYPWHTMQQSCLSPRHLPFQHSTPLSAEMSQWLNHFPLFSSPPPPPSPEIDFEEEKFNRQVENCSEGEGGKEGSQVSLVRNRAYEMLAKGAKFPFNILGSTRLWLICSKSTGPPLLATWQRRRRITLS